MKSILAALAAAITLTAAAAEPVRLPAPAVQGGKSFLSAVASRQSQRSFDPTRSLSPDTLSTLLWVADGINRPDQGRRTAPSAMNRQEIDVYVLTSGGAYIYDPHTLTLLPVSAIDLRPLAAGSQQWVCDAPAVLVLVADAARFGSDDDRARTMMAVDAGIVSQNINLFCSASGLATVPRASMDTDALRKALGLRQSQTPLLNNPVGYPAR